MVFGGAGRVGSFAVEYLARTPGIEKIWIADMSDVSGHCLALNSSIGAAFDDSFPDIQFIRTNALDQPGLTRTLISTVPDIILNASTTYSSYLYNRILSEKMREHGLESRCPGHMIAKDLLPLYWLMKSLKGAGLSSSVVNVCFPDIAHPVLAKLGLCPVVGAGEVALLAQGLRRIVSTTIRIPMSKIEVVLIANHALLVNRPETVPYYARIQVEEDDVTEKFDLNKRITEAQQLMFKVPEWFSSMTASHAVRIVRAILHDTHETLLAPGADGMAGCLPTRVNSAGATVELPQELSTARVETMFSEGLKIDGIERIEDDGTIVFSEPALQILRKILCIDRKVLRISELKEMNDELLRFYDANKA